MSRVYLKDIVDKKLKRIAEKKYDLYALSEKALMMPEPPSFYHALAKDGLSIIGEVKKASPSKGVIKEDFKPLEIARLYEGAVDAISVLTEEDYFLGKDEYLAAISQNVSIPTLCKDFILTEYQVYQARCLGASAILLIVAILSDETLKRLMNLAKELMMEVLVEVHTKEELDRALVMGADIIGINNRNLSTFVTDLGVTMELRKYIPSTTVVVSESGIDCIEDIKRLKEVTIDAILVGESFMRTEDIRKHAGEFKDAYKS